MVRKRKKLADREPSPSPKIQCTEILDVDAYESNAKEVICIDLEMDDECIDLTSRKTKEGNYCLIMILLFFIYLFVI